MKVYKVSSAYDEMVGYVPNIKVNNAVVYTCCNEKICIVYTDADIDADINAEKIGEEYEFNYSKCVELLKRYSG